MSDMDTNTKQKSSAKKKPSVTDEEKKKIMNDRALAYYYKNSTNISEDRSLKYAYKQVDKIGLALRTVRFTKHERDKRIRLFRKNLEKARTWKLIESIEIDESKFLPPLE